MRTIMRVARLLLFTLWVLLGVTFAVSNRQTVSLTFFPLPYEMNVPLFIVALFLFTFGAITAWVLMRFSLVKERMTHRKALKRTQALESEIAQMRAEQLAKQAPTKPLALVK